MGLFDSLVCGCCVRFWWGIAFLWFSILGVRDGSLRSGVAVVVVLCCCSGYLGVGFSGLRSCVLWVLVVL